MMIMNGMTNVIINTSSERYYVFGTIVFVFDIWVIIGTGIALILEFVMNLYYCNSCHVICEILVRKILYKIILIVVMIYSGYHSI